jgi:predicted acyl esterase
MPKLPLGVKAPVVVVDDPYVGDGNRAADPDYLETKGDGPVRALIENGTAFVQVSVRGTGVSDGKCDWMGPSEGDDAAFIVEWLAAQPWSNGRVGLIGNSWPGTTPIMAAVRAPPHLDLVVTGNSVYDLYEMITTPEGAALPATFDAGFTTASATFSCFDNIGKNVGAQGEIMDRNASFWRPRDLLAQLPNATSAMLLAPAFGGVYSSTNPETDYFAFQNAVIWSALEKAPKSMILGQWGDQMPDENSGFNPAWERYDWPSRVVASADYWLKGVGSPPQLGNVEFEDNTGAWTNTTSWPPHERRDEVLYLNNGALTGQSSSQDMRLASAPTPGGERCEEFPFGVCTVVSDPTPNGTISGLEAPYDRTAGLCTANPATSLLFTTPPVTNRAIIAGNPVLYSAVSSTQPGGILDVNVYDLGPSFGCRGANATDATFLRSGAADLRFLHGNYVAEPFPINTPTTIRIDIQPLAIVLAPGHKLAITIGAGDAFAHSSGGYEPVFTLSNTTQLLLPLEEGTLHGAALTTVYPPRPFDPEARG